MPRSVRVLLAAVALALLAAPTPAHADACPGAAVCPYAAAAVVGQRAEGVLRFPQAVAVGPDGSVYVADQYSHAIQVFSPAGVFERELGSSGAAPDGLTSVGGVAVASDNSVYVADGSNRIVRFAADGSVLDSWGKTGSGVGQLNFGAGLGNASGAGGGIAVGNGMVYVADTRNDRIERFAADGSHATVIVPPGRLSRPQGIALSGSRLIVADDDHHRLAVFDTGGRFIKAVGSGPGAKPGQLSNPYDVAVDPSGRLYVADDSNHRVVRYGPASGYAYRARFGSYGSALGQMEYPRGIGADAAGNSYVADPGNNRIDAFNIGGTPLRAFGTSGRNPGQFIMPMGVGSDASGLRAVADSIVGRVQLLNPDGSVAAVYGSPAPGPTLLPDPVATAFDGAGTAYVLDQQRGAILVFDRNGKIVKTIGSRGTGAGHLLAPSALALDAAGDIYVADTGNGRIAHFTVNGGYVGSLGSFGSPRGVAVTPDGSRIYVADAGTDHIYVIAPSGQDISQFSGPGTKPGKLKQPAQIALDAAGTLWVANRGNHRVDAFGLDGKPVAEFGQRGTGTGQFEDPTGIDVNCQGLITVADTNNNRVQQFSGGAAAPCAPLPAVQSPPPPVLPTAPPPVPPQLTVKQGAVHGLLARRTLPLQVRCDVPCTIAVVAKVRDRATPKKGHARAAATLSFKAVSIAAGKWATVKAKLSAAQVASLRKQLGRHTGLLARVQVTASTSNSAPTTVSKSYDVTTS